MTVESKKYCFDTSCFIDPWHNFYSRKSHASYWDDFILKKIMDGDIVVLEEMYKEIERKDDDLCAWFKDNNIDEKGGLLIKTDSELAYKVTKLSTQYPRLSDSTRGRSITDPFLIAYAKENNVSVVTLKKLSGNQGTAPSPVVLGVTSTVVPTALTPIKYEDTEIVMENDNGKL